MVDRDLLQKLHNDGVIDKRYVLWWQLGFEGRRILTQEEFDAGLQTVSLEIEFDERGTRQTPSTKEFRFWIRDEVPILIKDVNIDGIKVPCFVSVKPISHDAGIEGVTEVRKYTKLSPDVYLQPHIRGVLIEMTDRFLFWYPIGLYDDYYSTKARYVESAGMFCILNPIRPTKFYTNLIRSSWRGGRRPQKSAEKIVCSETGFQIVPYYEFDPTQPHLAVYPAPIFRNRLDIPILFASRDKGVDILGTGYLEFEPEGGGYWDLDKRQKGIAKSTLIERFGYVQRVRS